MTIKPPKLNIHSSTVRMIFFMLIIAVVLLVTFSIPVVGFLNSSNKAARTDLAKLNSGYMNIITSDTLEQLAAATIDSNIISAVVTPIEDDNNKKLSMAQVSLSRLNNSIVYTDSLSLYIDNADTIVTSDYSFASAESKGYEYIGYYLNNLNFCDTIRSNSHQGKLFVYDKSIYMALEFPQSGNKRLGIIFAQLADDIFTSYLSTGNGSLSGCYVIGTGNTIYTSLGNIADYADFTASLPQYDLTVGHSWSDSEYSYTISPVENSSLRVLNADSNTYGNTVKALIKLLLPLSLIVIIDFIFLIVLFNNRYLRPLHKINKSLSDLAAMDSPITEDTDNANTSSELSDIESAVTKLIDTHRKQDVVFESVKDELFERLFTELINGRHASSQYYARTLSSMNAPIDADGCYILTVLHFANSSSDCLAAFNSSVSYKINEQLLISEHPIKYATLIHEDKLIILLEFLKEAKPAEISVCLSHFNEILDASRNAEDYFDTFQSELYNNIGDTGFIFETLLEPAAQERMLYSVSYFSNKINDSIELIKADSLNEAEEALNSVIDAALDSAPDEQTRKVIASSYLTACAEQAYTGLSIRPDSNLHEVSHDLCMSVNEYFTKRKNKYAAATIEYVSKHYADTDLSLEKTAEALGVHFNYLSRVFKANMDENFTSYVSKYRIEQAKLLLKDPKLKINDISVMTGFGSQQNFSKVFKKYELITPGKYRELHSDRS